MAHFACSFQKAEAKPLRALIRTTGKAPWPSPAPGWGAFPSAWKPCLASHSSRSSSCHRPSSWAAWGRLGGDEGEFSFFPPKPLKLTVTPS